MSAARSRAGVVSATLATPRAGAPMTAAERKADRKANPPLAMITLTVMLGLIMAIIDASIVNVALNDMAGNLGSSIDEIGWVATGYILANVIVMPLNGWLTARFGRRNFYASCIVIFTLSSLLCGTATNVWQLVFYRVIQGFGGGALQPTAQAILFESYPPEKRAGAMAIFGLGAMVGPAIGPTLGGIIVDNYSWPLIFYINIPIGIVAFLMTLAYIRDPVYLKRDRSPIDYMGLGLLTAGLASLQYVLERGQREDWFSSSTIVGAGDRGRRVADDLLLQGMVRSAAAGRFESVQVARVLGRQHHRHRERLRAVRNGADHPALPAERAGLHRDRDGVRAAARRARDRRQHADRVAPRRQDRRPRDHRVRPVAVRVATWLMGGINQQSGYWDVFWPRAAQGFALGFLFVPLTTAALGDVVREKMANATGIYTLVRQLGGSLGIAILQFLQTRFADNAYVGLAGGVSSTNPADSHFLNDLHGTAAQLYNLVVLNATVISYDMVLRLCSIVFVLSIPLVLLLKWQRAGRRPRGGCGSRRVGRRR